MQHIFKITLCSFLFLFFSASITFSQGFSEYNWYFGTSGSGIAFSKNTGNPEAVNISALNFGGTATASNPYTGTILFYTDGNTVYESTNNIMFNGNGLNGNSTSNQPVAICNVPGATDQYYIFTNSASFTTSGTIEYTIVNMAATGNSVFPAPGLGEVDLVNKNMATGITNASEAMAIIPNANEDGFWLITHENGANNYIVLPIDNTGTIGAPVTTSLGNITVAGNISAQNIDSDTLAVSPQNQNEEVELIRIDRATGVLSFELSVTGTGNSDFTTEAIFDTEWSNNDSILYISRHGEAATNVANIMQYDVYNASLINVLPVPVFRSYGLQMGPDNSIYHIYQETATGPFLLGRITTPDTLITNANFRYESSLLRNIDVEARQFSALLPDYDPGLTLSFSPNTGCLNSQMIFAPILTNAAGDTVNVDRAFWDFGDGAGFSNSIIPNYTYTDQSQLSPTLNLAVESGGQIYTTSGTITLSDFLVQISMTSDTTFCTEDFPPPIGSKSDSKVTAQINGNYTSLNWFGPSGELTALQGNTTLTADSAGYYYVVVSDGSGCSTYAGVNVTEYGAAEQRANFWYFGQNAGIDFNTGAVAVNDGQMSTIEGCAAISDRNGQIILYTDGVNVYDKEHTQITNKGIGGEQDATQSSIIVPFVGDETLYYIFTTEELYGQYSYQLKYSIFDLKLNNGTGALISENTLVFSPSTERITASNNWLIAHEFGNNTFRAYPMTGTGIGEPVYSNIGASHAFTNAGFGQGYMELGVNNRLVVATSNPPNENYIEIFDFIDTTGILTNYRQIDMSQDGAVGQVYGIEASSGGNKLFASVRNGGSSQLFEYFFDSLDNPHFRQSLNISQEAGAIQLGPDGQVYVALNGSSDLGTITVNEDTTQNSILDPTAAPFALAGGTTSTLGLPNFIQNISVPALTPTMTVMNGCPGDALNFTATGTDPIDEFRWNIVRDSDNVVVASSSAQNPTFTGINDPGTYTASVFIYNHCVNSPDFTIILPFEIYTPPAFTIGNVVDVTGACGDANGSFDVNVTTSGSFSYIVLGPVSSASTSQTGPTTITIGSLSAGAYNVIVTDNTNGCSTTVSQGLNDPIQFSSTYTTTETDCDGLGGSVVVTLSGTIGNNTINYSLVNQATGQLLTPDGSGVHDASTSMEFTISNVLEATYSLQLEDGASPACSEFTTDIVVASPPDTELTLPLEASACGETSVTVDFTSNTSSGISITGPGNAQATATTITFGTPGTYTVTALGDGITNCDYSQDIEIIFNDVTPSPLQRQYIICPEDPRPGFSSTTLKAGTDFVSVNWYDDQGNSLDGLAGYTVSGDSIVADVPGVIVAEMTNPFGCVTMDTVTVVEDCVPRIVAPNAFKPNSSLNENQSFSIYHLFVSEDNFSVFIFNRWGEMVYQSNDVNFTWNGGFNDDFSQPLPAGTYAYVMRYVDENNPESGQKQQRGGVLLIR